MRKQFKKSVNINSSAYTRLGHAAFQQVFSDIIQAILSEPQVFTDLPFPPEELRSTARELLNLTNAAKDGSRTAQQTRNVMRERATAILYALSLRVLLIAKTSGNGADQKRIVTLSKFTASKSDYQKRTYDNPQVQNLSCKWTGKEGEAFVRWKKMPDVNIYIAETTFSDPMEADTIWHFAGQTSRRKIVLKNLPQQSPCWVRVTAYYGKDANKSIPSQPALVTIAPVMVR